MSGGQTMVVLIVAIVMIAGIVRARYGIGAGRGSERGSDGASQAENRMLREEVRTLKERVAVLERVITDNNSSLSLDREIEALRDERRS